MRCRVVAIEVFLEHGMAATSNLYHKAPMHAERLRRAVMHSSINARCLWCVLVLVITPGSMVGSTHTTVSQETTHSCHVPHFKGPL